MKLHFCIDPMTILDSHQALPHHFTTKLRPSHSDRFDESLPNCLRCLPLLLQKEGERMLPIPTRLQKQIQPGRVPTTQNRAHSVCKGMWWSFACMGWNEAKWAYEIVGFAEPSPSTLEQKRHWHFWTSSLVMKSTRSSCKILNKLSSSAD